MLVIVGAGSAIIAGSKIGTTGVAIWVFLIFPTVGGVLAGLVWKQVVQPSDA